MKYFFKDTHSSRTLYVKAFYDMLLRNRPFPQHENHLETLSKNKVGNALLRLSNKFY